VGGTERHFSPEEVAAAVDRPAGSYGLRAQDTPAEPVAHPPALSMRRLITLAGASPDALSFVSIERPNGSLALLGRADLADPAPFPDGPPIVWMDAGGARYLRPLRGPGDANATDNVDITGGDLVVRVQQGPLLVVRARADHHRAPAGRALHLSAEVVSGAAPGTALRFTWRFGDGRSASGQAVSHAFDEPGVYEAVATVSGADDSGGASQPLRITVGRPPKARGDTGGGTADRRRAPAQGREQGGADENAAPAPAAPKAAAPNPNTATATAPRAAPPATSPRRSARPRRTPQPAAPAPAAPKPAESKPAARAPARTPPARRAVPRRPPPAGPVVRGVLVASRTAAALPGGGVTAAASAAPLTARRGEGDRRGPLAPAGGILAALALVGAGVARERRAARPARRWSE